MLDVFLKETLDDLNTRSLKRTLKPVDGVQSARIIIDGKNVLNLCSNNYLGLADDKRLEQAAMEAIKKEGLGSGASRLVCGNMESHRALEMTLAKFKGTESAIVFSTGYMANVGIISSLYNRHDAIFSDKLSHASITDGILLSGAELKRYPHNDMEALEAFLKKADSKGKRVIITDSVFSMDGDIAPLDKIVRLAKKYHTAVMVDEAHALGVFGKNGKGLAEHFGLEKEIDIQMGTLSKAAGAFGAYCCGSKELIEFLVNKARSFIYTTGLPPVICAAAARAIDIIQAEPLLRQKLWDHTHFVQNELRRLGFDIMNSQSPIIPILVKDSKLAVEFSKRLFDEGIFVSAIRPPTVPQNTARLRVTVMAAHSRQDLESAVEKFEKIGKQLRAI